MINVSILKTDERLNAGSASVAVSSELAHFVLSTTASTSFSVDGTISDFLKVRKLLK